MHFYVREWPNLTGNIKSMIGLCVFIVKLVVFMVFMVSSWLSHVVYGSRRLSFFFDLAVTWSDTFNASFLLKGKCELQENFSNFNKWKKKNPTSKRCESRNKNTGGVQARIPQVPWIRRLLKEAPPRAGELHRKLSSAPVHDTSSLGTKPPHKQCSVYG